MIETILVGIVSGLAVVLLAWLARRSFLARRLHLIQPKLLDYSGLGGDGTSKTIELTVINTGRTSEEAVRIQFAPGFKYHVIASNAPGLGISGDGILEIDRLSPRQEVTLVVMAEGGEFKKEHVLGISSKETVGSIKSSIQDAQTTPAQLTAGLAFLSLFLVLGYGAGKFIEVVVWPDLAPYFNDDVKIGFNAKLDSSFTSGDVAKDKARELLASASIESVVRNDDTVRITVNLAGLEGSTLSYTLSTTSPVAELRDKQTLRNFDYIEADVLVFDGKKKSVVLTDYMPESVDPQLILLDVKVEEGEWTLFSKYSLNLSKTQSE